ncbi:MAG: glutamate formimidoyltransferase, partial [Actinomycetota bacterium]
MIIEAVPNFSEGRRPEVCEKLADEARARGVRVLDLERDPDHHRSVLTFVGAPDPTADAAFAVAAKAVELIDLTRHEGQHPRMGAIDVLPFVPLQGASMADAVALARRVGERIGKELGLPVFLYEAAATRPDRRNLAVIRKPQFEGLRELIGKDPDRVPDFGPNRIHPTAGCVAVGARMPLIAYNVDLETDDVGVAKKIAKKVRERDGGLPGIKALGLAIADRKCAQVSMNVCDFTRTGLLEAFRAVEAEAAKLGVRVRSSEIVGLVPRASLPPDGEQALRLAGFKP